MEGADHNLQIWRRRIARQTFPLPRLSQDSSYSILSQIKNAYRGTDLAPHRGGSTHLDRLLVPAVQEHQDRLVQAQRPQLQASLYIIMAATLL